MNVSLEARTGKSYRFPLHKLRMRRAEGAQRVLAYPQIPRSCNSSWDEWLGKLSLPRFWSSAPATAHGCG